MATVAMSHSTDSHIPGSRWGAVIMQHLQQACSVHPHRLYQVRAVFSDASVSPSPKQGP